MISNLHIFPTLLSSGRYTVGVGVQLKNGIYEWDASPIGTTTSAIDPKISELSNVGKELSEIKDLIIGNNIEEQEQIDKIIFKQFSEKKCGANTAIALSAAIARAASVKNNLPLHSYFKKTYGIEHLSMPDILSNIVGGGGHHKNNMNITELMICTETNNIYDNIRNIIKVRNLFIDELSNHSFEIGIEGCVVPQNIDDFEAIGILTKITSRFFEKFSIAADFACICEPEYVNNLLSSFDIKYIEDPYSSENSNYYKSLMCNFGNKAIIAGDDITVGRIDLLSEYYNSNMLNAIVLKMNHVITITNLFKVSSFCKKNGIKTICSQRSQETGKDTMSHIAIASNADYLKFGSPIRERIVNYSNLIAQSKIL